MPVLDVPFLPDSEYLGLLARHADRIESVYFSLFDPATADARHRFRTLSPEALIMGLKSLPGIRKRLLLNSRFNAPRSFEPAALAGLWERIHGLKAAGALDGLVYADPYLLAALSDADPGAAAGIEAVPSVNFMMDTADRVETVLEAAALTAFAPATRIVPDRSLNRRPAALAALTGELRQRHPEIRIVLLANEGCLYQCPYKPAHDAYVAVTHLGPEGAGAAELNRDFGCRRFLGEAPERMFGSPFIRPEDMDRYRDHAQGFKLAGRSLGPGFMIRAVTAYLAGRYDGNLLDLTDAMDWLAARLYLDNRALPADFVDRLSDCGHRCGACGVCRDLYRRTVRPRPALLSDFRENADRRE